MSTDLLTRPSIAAMPVEIVTTKEAEDGKTVGGAIAALVSAYDLKYRIGYWDHHTIEAGTFDDSLAEQEAIPLYKQHDWQAGGAPIGHATAGDVTKPKPGLRIDGELYTDDADVARLHRALKAGALREWSIGYQVLEFRVDADDEDHMFVTKAQLLEVSLVLRGANPQTETLEVASHILGRPPTKAEAALLVAGKPLPQLAAAPDTDPDPKPKPKPSTERSLAPSWARELYHPSGS